MELGSVWQPAYGPGPRAPASSTPGLVALVHGFLRLVQPHGLPAELIVELRQEQSQISREQLQELLSYEVGFLVCAAIGLLFIVLMPLVGCCFCCCRCCGKCGGRMYQKQDRRSGCRRRALYTAVLLLSALLLAGDACAFVSNTRLSQAVSGAFPNANGTAGDLRTYLASIPQQIGFIAARSEVPLARANDSLQSIGTTLGNVIVSSIRRSMNEAVGSLQGLLQAMESLATAFSGIKSSSSRLQELQSNFSQRLEELRARINGTVQACGQRCRHVRLDGLAFAANFSAIPSVDQQLEALGEVSDSNLGAGLEKVNRTLSETPDTVHRQSREVVTRAQEQLGQIRREISLVPERVPVEAFEERGTALLDSATAALESYREPVTAFEKLRWSVCALLCCMVLLVVTCNAFGLLLGPLGLEPAAPPTERGCLASAAGSFFMAGVGFSFIFSWLLMLMVLVPFVLGGNIYMLLCQSLRDQQLLELLDTPGLIPDFNMSQVLGEGSPNISELYRQCRDNAALWPVLRLGQRLSHNVTHGSLLDLAAELEKLAVEVGGDAEPELQEEAGLLRALAGDMEASLPGPLRRLEENIRAVQRHAGGLQAQTNATLLVVERTQASLRTGTAAIVKNVSSGCPGGCRAALRGLARDVSPRAHPQETRAFLERLLGLFETYVAWAKSSLTRDVARCKPVAQTVDSVEAVACDHILDSVNAFWFSLGWCAALLPPGIVLAVRLAKFYRRMDVADVCGSDLLEMAPTLTSLHLARVAPRK
ncbi:prominin-1-A-like [Eudromia elegans]